MHPGSTRMLSLPRVVLQQVASINGPARAGCPPEKTTAEESATTFPAPSLVCSATQLSAARFVSKTAAALVSRRVALFFFDIAFRVIAIPVKTKAAQLLTHNFSSHLVIPLCYISAVGLRNAAASRSVITHPVVLSFTAILYRCPECRHA